MTRSQAIILEEARKLDQGETLEVALRLLERVGAPDPTSHSMTPRGSPSLSGGLGERRR